MDTPVVQPPAPPTIQPVPPPPKKNSGVLIGILLLLLGILVGVALTKTTILSGLRIPYLSATPTSTPIPSPTPTPNPMANWKTYTNQKLGFTVKYPSNLFFKEIDPNYGIVLAFEPFSNSEAPGAYFDSIGVQSDSNALFAFNILQQAIEGKTDIDIHQPCGVMVTKLVNKKFGVYDGVEYIYDGSNPPNGCGRDLIGYEHTILIRKSDSMFIKLVNGSIKPENTRQHDIVFDQILSTFKFFNTVTPSPTQQPIPSKALNYSVPSGWITVQDSTESFTVSYDPTTSKIDTNSTSGIFLLRQRPDPSLGYYGCESVNLYPYDGGSRHQFIYKYLGETPTNGSLRSDYKETEYLYNGKSCLLLNGISISQFNSVWGMCDVGNGKAFLFTSCDRDITNFEKILQTIHVLK